MKREDVTKVFEGATDEQINAILNINSADIGKAKGDFEALRANLETANNTISALNGELKTLKDNSAAAENWKQKYEEDTAALQKQLSDTQFHAALDSALEKSGAKNTKALRGLLDMDKIKFENNALTGFSEQLEQIKSENDFLFEAEKQKAGGMRQGGRPAGSEDIFLSGARAAAGLENKKGD